MTCFYALGLGHFVARFLVNWDADIVSRKRPLPLAEGSCPRIDSLDLSALTVGCYLIRKVLICCRMRGHYS
jgi:hypothetical protein